MKKHTKQILSGVLAFLMLLGTALPGGTSLTASAKGKDETTSLSIEKVWNDGDNVDGIRPDHSDVKLIRNNEVIDTVVLNDDNNWQVEYPNLPKYDENGDLYEYRAEEVDVPAGYSSVIDTKQKPEDPETLYSVKYVCSEGLPNEGHQLPSDVMTDELKEGDSTPEYPGELSYPGYTFAGWNPEVAPFVDPSMADEDHVITYTAQWTKNEEPVYHVIFDVELDDGPATYTYELQDGDPLTIPEVPERDAYIFKGWSPEPGTTVDASMADENHDIRFTGIWKAKPQYTVMFMTGIASQDMTVTCYEGDPTPKAPELSREGYEFNGWQPAISPTVTGNVVYVAQWTQIEEPEPELDVYRFIDNLKEGEHQWLKEVSITKGVEVPKEVYPEPLSHFGYHFTGWSDPVLTDGIYLITAEYEKIEKITVKWIDGLTDAIVLSKEFSSDVDLTDITYPEEPVHEGYSFIDWSEANPVSESEIQITAEYEKIDQVSIRVEFQTADGTIISVMETVVNKGSTYDVENDTRLIPDGYSLNGYFSGDDLYGTADSNKRIIVPVRLTNTTGVIATKSHKLTSNPNGTSKVEYTITVKNVGTTSYYGLKVVDTAKLDMSKIQTIVFDHFKVDGSDFQPEQGAQTNLIHNFVLVDPNDVFYPGKSFTITYDVKYSWKRSQIAFANTDINNEIQCLNIPISETSVPLMLTSAYSSILTLTDNTPVIEEWTGSDIQIQITNSHQPVPRFFANVTTNWDDSNDKDEIRPDSFTVDLLQNGNIFRSLTLEEADNWETVVENLPSKNPIDGTAYDYTLGNISAMKGYTSTVQSNWNEDGSLQLAIDNHHTLAGETSVAAQIVWNDNNNADNIRPTTLVMHVLKDGEKIKEVTLSESNNWTDVLNGLAKEDPKTGHVYVYSVELAKIPAGYTAADKNGVLELAHEPAARVDLTIKAAWNDEDNIDEKRPTSIQAEILRNGETFDIVTLSNDKNYAATLSDVLKEDPIQKEDYAYTLRILNAPDDYEITIDGLTITGSYTPAERMDLSMKVVWDDDGNKDGIRPDELAVEVLQDGQSIKSVVLQKETGYGITVADVLKINPETGADYVYTLKATAAPAGYTCTVNGTDLVAKHEPVERMDLTIKQEWAADEAADRPESVLVDVLCDGAVINTVTLNTGNDWAAVMADCMKTDPKTGAAYTYTIQVHDIPGYETSIDGFSIVSTKVKEPETPKTTFTVKAVWNDAEDKDGIRPETLYVNITRNKEDFAVAELSEKNNWEQVFENVEAGDGENPYTFTAIPTPVTGYSLQTKAEDDVFVITGTHKPIEKYSIVTEVIWEDENNKDDIRPESVEVEILQNEALYKTVTLDEAHGWRSVLLDVPKTDAAGKAHVYEIREPAAIEGYTMKLTTSNESSGPRFGITLTHEVKAEEPDIKPEPEFLSIDLKAVWADENDKDEIRPTSVDVVLLQNGTIYKTVTLTANKSWKAVLENVPKTDADGVVYNYTLDEPTDIDGYTAVVQGYQVLFSHTPKAEEPDKPVKPELTEITAEIIWNDEDDKDGLRPSEIVLTVLQNGDAYSTAAISKDNNWKATVKNLPKTDANGNVYTYMINAPAIDEYTAAIDGCKVTYSHTPKVEEPIIPDKPEVFELTVTAAWDDEDDKDGIRPESIEAILLQNGDVHKTLTLSKDQNWSVTIPDLVKTDADGNDYVYTIRIDAVPEGYKAAANDLSLTLRHEPKPDEPTVKEIPVKILWNDEDDKDKIRPQELVVELLQNDAVHASITLTGDNDWQGCFENLPTTDEAGNAYTYMVQLKTAVTDYETSITTDDDGTFVITNTHIPAESDEPAYNGSVLPIIITWEDNNNLDKIRPESVEVIVYRNGSEIGRVHVTAANGWTYRYEGLKSRDENDNKYVYTIKPAKAVDGYKATIEGNKIIFKHVSTTVPSDKDVLSLTIRKIWDDGENADKLRPENVTITLYQNGKVFEKVTLNETCKWSKTITNLPRMDENEKAYTYSVEEVHVPSGYEASVKGFDVTNKHVPKNPTTEPDKTTPSDVKKPTTSSTSTKTETSKKDSTKTETKTPEKTTEKLEEKTETVKTGENTFLLLGLIGFTVMAGAAGYLAYRKRTIK